MCCCLVKQNKINVKIAIESNDSLAPFPSIGRRLKQMCTKLISIHNFQVDKMYIE